MKFKCSHCGKQNEINVGAAMGSVTSAAKAEASRANGAKGGRPKSKKPKRPRDSVALAHSVVADAIKRTEQSPV